MGTRQCYHCKAMIEDGDGHDCWTTTEAALTQDLSDDLRDAWDRLRETAVEFGDQRIYASHRSIMFSRKSCYCFVRPKRQFLEVCVFLGRPINAPPVKRVDRTSRSKVAHMLHIRHRDEVEAPITDWLQEAYEYSAAPAPATTAAPSKATPSGAKKRLAANRRKPAKAAAVRAGTTARPKAKAATEKKVTRARAAGSRNRSA
jgi:hypothetical protein